MESSRGPQSADLFTCTIRFKVSAAIEGMQTAFYPSNSIATEPNECPVCIIISSFEGSIWTEKEACAYPL